MELFHLLVAGEQLFARRGARGLLLRRARSRSMLHESVLLPGSAFGGQRDPGDCREVALQDARCTLAQVLQEVPAIQHLDRLRRSLLYSPLVFRGAVSSYDAELRVLRQPGVEGFSRAVIEQIYGPMPFEIHDDRALPPALQEREVVHADDLRQRK